MAPLPRFVLSRAHVSLWVGRLGGRVYGRRVVRWWSNTLAGWSDVIGWTFAIMLIGGIVFGIGSTVVNGARRLKLRGTQFRPVETAVQNFP